MWELAISAGASLLGGLLGGSGEKKAAQIQAASADKATALSKEIYYDQRGLLTPAYLTGGSATNKLAALYGITPQNYAGAIAGDYSGGPPSLRQQVTARSADPAFGAPYAGGIFSEANGALGERNDALLQQYTALADQYANPDTTLATPGQETGQQISDAALAEFMASPYNKLATETSAIDFGKIRNQLGAAGKSISGAGEKRYAKTLAGNRYGAFTDYTNGLRAIAGMNQTAASGINSAGSTYAANAGNTLMAAGNARAEGLKSSYDSYGNGIAGALGSLQKYGQNNWGWAA